MKSFNLKNKKISQISVNYYYESTSSPSLDEVIEPVYNENNKKLGKSKRSSNKNKANKSLQVPTQVPKPKSKPVTSFQQLFSLVPLLGRTLPYVKIKFKEELHRSELIDTGALKNVISR